MGSLLSVLRIIYVFLAVPIVLSIAYFGLGFGVSSGVEGLLLSVSLYSLLSPLAGALKPWNKITCLSAAPNVRSFSANHLLCLISAVGRLGL